MFRAWVMAFSDFEVIPSQELRMVGWKQLSAEVRLRLSRKQPGYHTERVCEEIVCGVFFSLPMLPVTLDTEFSFQSLSMNRPSSDFVRDIMTQGPSVPCMFFKSMMILLDVCP